MFLGNNLLMTHNFTFLFPHPISSVKSIVLKIVSLPYMPGAVITPFPSILINLTLFSSEPGNAFILSRTSPRSMLRARLFQWRTTSGYSASQSTITCGWTSTWTKSCSNGGPRQATRRHNRQSPVDGQARERSQSHMFLPPACITIYSTSHHRQQCQHDCLLSRRLAARLRQRRVFWNII